MGKVHKVLFVGMIMLALMIAAPSMAGIAQSFIGNNDLNQNGQEVNGNEIDYVKSPEAEKNTEIESDIENSDVGDNTVVIDVGEPEEVVDKPQNTKADPTKKVFLTFDDGPTVLTPKILQILNESDVKATFFTIGKLVEKNPEWVKETYDQGHMVLPHTYSHDYSIYTTFESYYNDLELAKQSIENALDIEVPNILRFPGGSSNHSSFKYGGEQYMPKLTKDVKNKGYYYIDWNVSSGDASPDYDKKDKMIRNVIDGAKSKDFIVVLFHDTARNTMMAEALPEIILELKNQGYTFRTFRDITEDELDTMISLKLANKPIIRQ